MQQRLWRIEMTLQLKSEIPNDIFRFPVCRLIWDQRRETFHPIACRYWAEEQISDQPMETHTARVHSWDIITNEAAFLCKCLHIISFVWFDMFVSNVVLIWGKCRKSFWVRWEEITIANQSVNVVDSALDSNNQVNNRLCFTSML